MTWLKLLRPQDREEQIKNEPNRNDTHDEIFHNAAPLEFGACPGEQYKNQETKDSYAYINEIIHSQLEMPHPRAARGKDIKTALGAAPVEQSGPAIGGVRV